MSSGLKDFVDAWMLKAEHDIISAQRSIEIEPMILDIACFHCQQAIEKSLKAFLCYKEQEIEKTHNIWFLIEECTKYDSVFSTIDAKNINMYAVMARYPDDSLIPEIEEAKYFYDLAKHVYALVKEKFVF